MAKAKFLKAQFKNALGAVASKEVVQEILSIPEEDTTNSQGYKAYSLSDELRLISMLNTLKLEPQYYRSENAIMQELRDLIKRIGSKDPYFVAQAIVYSRCIADGMRSINHLGAALLAPFASGTEWAKRFYGPFDRKNQQGGCIYRLDDMSEIKDIFSALNSSILSGAMKNGFRKVLESVDGYQLAKYAKTTIDISNLVHPNSEKSNATVVLEGNKRNKFLEGKGVDRSAEKITVKVLDALMSGITISANTWEVANSEAGQEVAKAVKEGKLTEEKAKANLIEAKNQNFLELLREDKLGILAALRNIRQMIKDPNKEVIDLLCALLSNGEKIRNGKIMPYQIDLAYEILITEFSKYEIVDLVKQALLKGYESSVPNLAAVLPGKTLVMLDCSGSMTYSILDPYTRKSLSSRTMDKAALIAATICKATGADIIRFGSKAEYTSYNQNWTVFDIAHELASKDFGGTNLAKAWNLAMESNKKYDRVIILSDCECNSQQVASYEYKNYIRNCCSPYVYCCDIASYGTVPLKGDKVSYYVGYGYKLFDDIATNEFNPEMHIEKVKKVVI